MKHINIYISMYASTHMYHLAAATAAAEGAGNYYSNLVVILSWSKALYVATLYVNHFSIKKKCSTL